MGMFEVFMTKVLLTVNERKIPLKEFMQEMLSNIIQGYLKTTKGVPENIENIKIEIDV
jgi:hypothetical protein